MKQFKQANVRQDVYDFDATNMTQSREPLVKRGEKPKSPTKAPTVYYHPTVKMEIDYLVAKAKEEVAWFGVVTEMENGYRIDEIFIPEQEVTSTNADVEEDQMMKFANELIERDICPSKILYWGHSHVNMAVSPSSTDEQTADEFIEDAPMLIRGIYNKRGDSKVDVFLPEHDVVFTCVPEETLILSASKQKIDDALENKVKSAPTYNYGNWPQRQLGVRQQQKTETLTKPGLRNYNFKDLYYEEMTGYGFD